MTTYIFVFKAGEIIEVNADSEENAWSNFYAMMRPLNNEQVKSLIHSVHYLRSDNEKVAIYP